MTMTTTTGAEILGTIPEEWCSHRELAGSTVGRGYCRGCGQLIEVEAIPVDVLTLREAEEREDQAHENGYADGRTDGIKDGYDEAADKAEELAEGWADEVRELAARAEDLADGLPLAAELRKLAENIETADV